MLIEELNKEYLVDVRLLDMLNYPLGSFRGITETVAQLSEAANYTSIHAYVGKIMKSFQAVLKNIFLQLRFTKI